MIGRSRFVIGYIYYLPILYYYISKQTATLPKARKWEQFAICHTLLGLGSLIYIRKQYAAFKAFENRPKEINDAQGTKHNHTGNCFLRINLWGYIVNEAMGKIKSLNCIRQCPHSLSPKVFPPNDVKLKWTKINV